MALTTDSKERKDTPLVRGCLDYFPDALAAVARVSKAGNDKWNPGEEMHHARGKSTDHADCIVRHLMDRGTLDEEDGHRHSAKVAWRALALLQEELEAHGEATLPRGARLPEEGPTVPNNIHERIAGDTPLARRIKNTYYGGTPFMVGTPVRHLTGYRGVIAEPPAGRTFEEDYVYVHYTHDGYGDPVDGEWSDFEHPLALEIL